MVVENRPFLADARVLAEAKALREQDFEVSVIAPSDATRSRSTYTYLAGIHIYTYPLPNHPNSCLGYLLEYSLSMFQTWWLSLRVLRNHGFDVIHAANPPDTFFFLHWFYFLLGKRFIFDQHDLTPEIFSVKFEHCPRLLRWIFLHILVLQEKCSYRVATCVITTNKSQRDRAIKHGCTPEKVFVVRNGPQLERMRRVPAEAELKRGRPHLLVYLGGMESQDGIDYALEALHELVYVHGRQDVSLALLGNGSSLPRLKQLAQELSIEPFVFFTGWVDDPEIMRYLSSADIGLCPDPQNGLNEFCTTIKRMEYMAMGLPIVAFDLIETYFTCQGTALYALPNSISIFAQKIAYLLDEPTLRQSMGQRARTLIEEHMNWEHDKHDLWKAYATLFPEMQMLSTSDDSLKQPSKYILETQL
ncbi:MAG: glycosyltransferase family 4 protein [Ktedonobacteraceae bacterium]